MHFSFCPHCGTKLIGKEIGDEGIIPYCENCSVPLWDMFTTSIIAAVVNEYGEVALLRQNYVSEVVSRNRDHLLFCSLNIQNCTENCGGEKA